MTTFTETSKDSSSDAHMRRTKLLRQRELLQRMRDDCDNLISHKQNQIFDKFTQSMLTAFPDSLLRHNNLPSQSHSVSLPSQDTHSLQLSTNSNPQESSQTPSPLSSQQQQLPLFNADDLDRNTSRVAQIIFSKTSDLCCLFGGQGYDNLSELRNIFYAKVDSDGIDFKALIKILSKVLEVESKMALSLAQIDHAVNNFCFEFSHGFNIEEWVSQNDTKHVTFDVPPWYLYSAPISYPLTFIVQMLRYLQLLSEAKITHEEFISRVCCSSGHSQGLMGALALSVSSTTSELVENIVKLGRLCIYQGLRCHAALQNIPDVYKTLKTGYLGAGFKHHGQPDSSCMLSIKGLKVDTLKQYLNEINSRTEVAFVGLKNAEDLFVVSGIPSFLSVLKETISKAELDKGKNRSSMFFLKVGAAFHSDINKDVVTLLENDAVRIGISAANINVPLIDTENGEILSATNVLRRLLELQATRPLDLPKILSSLHSAPFTQDNRKSPSDKKYIFDFGPGDGTAKMARNLLLASNKANSFTVIANSGKMRAEKYLDSTLIGIQNMF